MSTNIRGAGLSLLALTTLVMAACATTSPRPAPPAVQSTRHVGSYWFFVDNVTWDEQRKEDPAVLLWAALPLNRPGQTVRVDNISPRPTELLEEQPGGNRVAFWRIDKPAPGKPLVFRYDFEIDNQPINMSIDPEKVTRASPDSAEYRRYTVSEPWDEASPTIAGKAREIVGAETNPYRQAALIFDWIVANVTYTYPNIKDRGVTKAFAELKGDCGEFSHIFVTMMRSLGVPSRVIFANWYQGSGHAWAEMFLPPYGWIPVDTSGAQLVQNGLKGQQSEEKVKRFMETRGIPTREARWLFGHLYPNRMEVFVGENVALEGKTPGATRTFHFMQPGGKTAWPEAILMPGLSRKTVTAGFFLFGDDSRDEQKAQAMADEELAGAWLSAGFNERAVAGLTRSLAREPDDAAKLFQLGQAHFNLKHWDLAMDAFRRALAGRGGSIKPSTIDPWAHMFLGMSLDAQGRRAEALKEYQAAKDSGSEFGGVQAVAKKLLESPFKPDDKS